MTDWIFFGPSRLIALFGYAGFAIGFALIAAQLIKSLLRREVFSRVWFRHAAVFTGLLWIIFNLYESQVAAQAVSTVNAVRPPFRLDLFVLTPLLYVLTAFSIWALWTYPKPVAEEKSTEKNDQH
jgi:xanthosine utilization system XapX-like protein